jgi:hypothetical protein
LRESVVFAMTAFDPVDPKETRSLEGNAAANERLWQEIKALSPRPTKVWPTWGYNFDEGSCCHHHTDCASNAPVIANATTRASGYRIAR